MIRKNVKNTTTLPHQAIFLIFIIKQTAINQSVRLSPTTRINVSFKYCFIRKIKKMAWPGTDKTLIYCYNKVTDPYS